MFINKIAKMCATQLAKFLNQLNVENQNDDIGVEAPIVYQDEEDDKTVCQKGTFRSTLISYDLQPILNPGVSGTVFFAGEEDHEIEAKLNFQLSVWNLNPELDYGTKLKAIRKRIKFLVKTGDVVEPGQVLFQEDLLGTGEFVDAAKYKKGEDFKFVVTGKPDITYDDIRLDENSSSGQVNVKISGKHVTTGCNNQKVAGEAAKMCFVPNPKAKNLRDIKQLGGFVLYQTEGSHEETVNAILEGKAKRIPHVVVAAGSEAIKGSQISKQLWAATKYCMTGKQSIMQIRDTGIEGCEGRTSYPTDADINEINTFIDASVRQVTGVRYFRDQFRDILEAQYNKNKNVSFEGNYMFCSGDAMFGMHHTTTELSLTEENKSKGGKIYWEGLTALHNLNSILGYMAYATGERNRKEMEIILDVAEGYIPESKTVWEDEHVVEFENSSSIISILNSAPKNLCVNHSMGNLVYVSTDLAKILGLTPNGGVNLIAKCVIDIIRHYSVTDERDADWYRSRDALLNIYVANCYKSVIGEGGDAKNTQLKNSTKSGKIVYTMKVRGVESPWCNEGEVYLPSNDTWAARLQGHEVLVWRNPNPSYSAATVKIVGPATEECPEPDIILPRQVVAKSCLTVPSIDWYGPNNGDDDGDLCNFVSIDELMKWAYKTSNKETLKCIPQLHNTIYPEG